jgi:chemotaxis protein MotB
MAKKQHHEEHENLERWLVSYADFITLLFAFFTILYALGQTDKAKYQKAIESIQKAFLTTGGVFPQRGSPFTPFEKEQDKGSLVPPAAKDMGPNSKAEQEAMSRIAEQLKGIFERSTGLAADPKELDVVKTANGFKIRMGEAMLFSPNSDKLKREQIPFLFEMGKRLAKLNLPIQVEGHSDKSERLQKGDSNHEGWQLSVNRSFNILKFLVEGTDFPKQNISIAGFGDLQPLASNDSPEGRRKNRRVEIAVITPDQNIKDLEW